MEKQSTRKFFSLMIATVALFVLGLSGVLLSACTPAHEHDYQKDNELSIAASCQSIGLEVFKCSEDGVWYAKAIPAIAHNFNDAGVCTCGLTKAEEVDYAKELEASFNKVQTAINSKIEQTALDLLKKDDIKDLATSGDVEALQKALEKAIEDVKYDDAALKTIVNEVKTQLTTINTELNNKLDAILNAVQNAHKHTLGEVTTVEATCRDAGYKYATCSTCGEVVTTEIIPASEKAHVWNMEDAQIVEATCAREGFTVYGCKYCNSVLNIVLPIDASKHEMGVWTVKTAATCTTKGVEVRTCANCDYEETQDIDTAAHTYGDAVIVDNAVDCTGVGTSTKTCTVCGDKLVEDAEAKYTEHAYAAGTRTLTNCEIGYLPEVVKCAHCDQTKTLPGLPGINPVWHANKLLENESIVATSEIIAINVANNTATVADFKVCPDCGQSVKVAERTTYHIWKLDEEAMEEADQDYIAFDEEANAWKNTSCTEVGYVYYFCMDDNCTTKDAEGNVTEKKIVGSVRLDALDHDYQLDTTSGLTKAATCTEAGNNHYVCSHNADHTKDEVVAANGHTPGEWTVIEEPTCTETGLGNTVCTVEGCGVQLTEAEIPATGHSPIISDPVYTTVDGVHYETITTTCENCDWSDTKTNAIAGEHQWIKLDRHDGGCDSTLSGHAIYVCELCAENAGLDDVNDILLLINKETLQTIFANGGAYISNEIIYGANAHGWEITSSGANTCIDTLQKEYTCKYCGMRDTITNNVPAGHTWVKVEGEAPTCDVAGTKTYYYCSVCNEVIITNAEPDKMAAEYLGIKNTDAELAEAIAIAAVGHTFDKVVTLQAVSCTAPAWKITVCSVCGVNDDESIVLKADAEGFTPDATNYTAPVVEGATDEQIAAVIALINENGITITELTNGIGYNFTAVAYQAKNGHTWTQLVAPTAPTCQEVGYEGAYYCSVCGVVHKADEVPANDVEPNTEYVVTETPDESNKDEIIANFVIDKVDHSVKYYKYVVTNEDDVTTAIVTDEFVMNGDKKAVYTFDEIKAAGHTITIKVESDTARAPEIVEVVNCYYMAFCEYDCGTDLGFNKQHVYPTDVVASDSITAEILNAKLPNCQHAGYCVFCREALLPVSGHTLTNVADIADTYSDALAEVEKEAWYKKDVAPTCTEEGINYTISVCLGCLEAIQADKNVTWVASDNYKVVDNTVPATGHTWKSETYTTGTNDASSNCLLGSYKLDKCEVCETTRIETEDAELTGGATEITDADGRYAIVLPKSHKVAPRVNYWLTENYKVATEEHSAWIPYVCIECGATVQGYYAESREVTGTTIVLYTMASDAEIVAYNEAGHEYGEVVAANAEDRVPYVVAATAEALTAALAGEATVISVQVDADIAIDTIAVATGKTIVLSLNGNTVTTTARSEFAGATLTIKNGKVVSISTNGAFRVTENGALNLENVEVTTSATTGSAIVVGTSTSAANGKLSIVNCTILSSGNYAISTNAAAGGNVEIEIINSTLTVDNADKDSTALLVNVPGKVTISGSTLTAQRQVIILRGGQIEATISNTELNLTAEYAGSFDNDGAWASGNEVPAAAIVVGSDTNTAASYAAGATTVTLINVTYTNTTAAEIAQGNATTVTVTIND